jgi:hypothetical protein
MVARRLIFLTLILAACSLPVFPQSKATGPKKNLALRKAGAVGCISGEFSFRCPRGYKVLLSGTADDRIFFAKNSEFGYGVFAIFESEAENLAESFKKLVKLFVPKGSQEFEWKEVVADPRKSSKFETVSKRRVGINKPTTAYLVLEYRQIEFNGKKILTGTVVNDFEDPNEARTWFEKGTFSVNGACFDSMDIISAFTKEKLDPEKSPCAFEITVKMEN